MHVILAHRAAENCTPLHSTLSSDTRVSTDEQDTAAQFDALRAEGCAMILEDKASAAARGIPAVKAVLP
jgi:alkylated DNA nucleotide flippase Atl1